MFLPVIEVSDTTDHILDRDSEATHEQAMLLGILPVRQLQSELVRLGILPVPTHAVGKCVPADLCSDPFKQSNEFNNFVSFLFQGAPFKSVIYTHLSVITQ